MSTSTTTPPTVSENVGETAHEPELRQHSNTGKLSWFNADATRRTYWLMQAAKPPPRPVVSSLPMVNPPKKHTPSKNKRLAQTQQPIRKRDLSVRIRKRMRTGTADLFSGELVRDARIALLASSWRPFQRRTAALALLSARSLVWKFHDSSIYIDDDDDDTDDGDTDDGDTADNHHPISSRASAVLSALRQLDGVDSINPAIVTTIANRISQFADELQTRRAVLEPTGNTHDTHSPRLGAWRTATYRTRAFAWLHHITTSSQRTPAPQHPNEPAAPYTKRRKRTSEAESATHLTEGGVHSALHRAFLSPTELCETVRTTEQLALVTAPWAAEVVHNLFESQVSALVTVMVEPDDRLARQLVRRHGSARACLHAHVREVGSHAMRAIHGWDAEFNPACGDGWRIARSLRHAFGSLANAQTKCFGDFLDLGTVQDGAFDVVDNLDNLDNLDKMLHLSPDECVTGFRSVQLAGTWMHPDHCAAFDASWRLFVEVCRACDFMGSDTDALRTTRALLDESAPGVAVLHRLASEGLDVISGRADGLSSDECLKLKLFAMAFIESAPNGEHS